MKEIINVKKSTAGLIPSGIASVITLLVIFLAFKNDVDDNVMASFFVGCLSFTVATIINFLNFVYYRKRNSEMGNKMLGLSLVTLAITIGLFWLSILAASRHIGVPQY